MARKGKEIRIKVSDYGSDSRRKRLTIVVEARREPLESAEFWERRGAIPTLNSLLEESVASAISRHQSNAEDFMSNAVQLGGNNGEIGAGAKELKKG